MKVFKTHSNWRKVSMLSACFVLALLAMSACKKQKNTVGSNLLDPETLISAGGIDTFTLVTYSVSRDSIPTQNQNYAILGSMHDPKMGIFKASFYSQFDYEGTVSLPAESVATIDSVILGLKYSGDYGKLDEQTFEVYRVADELYYDSTYYRTNITNVTGSNLVLASSSTQTPDVNNNPIVQDTNTPPQLRLKLENSFGQQFIDDLIAGNAAFSSHDDFKSTYFRGLRVSTTATNPPKGTGGILYFDLNSTYSYLNIYYHLQGDTTLYNLELARRAECLFYNQVDVNYNGYYIDQVLNNSLNGQKEFYCQAFTTQARVEFPTVDALTDKHYFIHQALLYLPVEYQTFDPYTPSPVFWAVYRDENGTIYPLDQPSYDDAQKALVINLRDHIQEIALGNKKNLGLYLYPILTFSQSAERTIFNGVNTPNKKKPKLIIKYSEFN